MGLFDVGKAEKKFRDLVGGKPKADELLKRLDKAEAQNYKGDRLVESLKSRFAQFKIDCNEDNLNRLFGNSGIVYLLSTKPHTKSNSNFVKLVKNKVLNKEDLKNYLGSPSETIPENVKNVKSSLIRYLKLTGKKEDDEIPEGETDVTDKLKRSKNKDVVEKMQSRRKVNRLKVMVVALLIYLIDKAQKDSQVTGGGTSPGTTIRVDVPQPPQDKGDGQKQNQETTGNQKTEQEQVDPIIIEGDKDTGGNTASELGGDSSSGGSVPNPKDENSIEDGLIQRLQNGTATKEDFKGLEDNEALRKKLTKLIIPKGVAEIPAYYFRGGNLVEVKIQGYVKIIGGSAFYGCDKLATLSIESGVEAVREYAFYNCKNLKTVIIPGTVKTIGEGAFKDCGELNDLVIGDGVENIGASAFKACGKLTSVTICGRVKNIGEGAFDGCPKDMKILSGDPSKDGLIQRLWDGTATKEDFESLKDNRELRNNLTKLIIPKGIDKIDEEYFSGCKNLTEVTIPGSVETIEQKAFMRCQNLGKLTIGPGVKKIGKLAFWMTAIESIEIPGSVEEIGDQAFMWCKKLRKILVGPGVKKIGKSAFELLKIADKKITPPEVTVSIPKSVESIGENAFGSLNIVKIDGDAEEDKKDIVRKQAGVKK